MSSASNNVYVDNTSARGNFASFLDALPATLSARTEDAQHIHMIMGNEAGDADSIISALVLGYVDSFLATKKQRDHDLQPPTTIVPIVSIPRADMALRRDVVLLLDLAGITAENLLYVDDDVVARHLRAPPPSGASSPSSPPTSSSITLTLVDHNRIRASLSHLSTVVTEIVDHHQDEKSHGAVTLASGKRSIAFENGRATVASTCTLVLERLLPTIIASPRGTSTAEAEDGAPKIDGDVGLLLLGVILLDSVNMLPAAGKGTPRDEEAMQMLLKYTNWSTSFGAGSPSRSLPSSSLVDTAALGKIFPNAQDKSNERGVEHARMPDRAALFDILSGAKNDPQFWTGLSVMDCLRIDYKKFSVSDDSSSGRPLVSSIGLSSVLLDADSFLAKDGLWQDLSAFMALDEDIGLFGIMTLNMNSGAPSRELLLTGPDSEAVDSFARYLLHDPEAAFLEVSERKECRAKEEETRHAVLRVFRQGNSRGSRKQVAPLLLRHASSAVLNANSNL